MDENTVNYLNAMLKANEMAEQGLINYEDYKSYEEKMAKKYGIKSGSLYRLNDLINTPFRVMNIVTKKEGENAD